MEYALKYIAATAVLLVGLFAGVFALFGVPDDDINFIYALFVKAVAFVVARALINVARWICPDVWDVDDEPEQVSADNNTDKIK